MATRILLTLLKTSFVVLFIIQLVTCSEGEVTDEADKPKTADVNNVEPTKQPLPPLPTDPRQLGAIFSLLIELLDKRPAVWDIVINSFNLSHLKLSQAVINFWNKYGWGWKKTTSTPTKSDQVESQDSQGGSNSADVEVRESSKPSVQADKETQVQAPPSPAKEAEVSFGTKQVAPPSNEQAAQAEVPQPPAAVSTNTQEAHPVQAEVPQPPAAVPSNTQEAHPAESNPSQAAGSGSPLLAAFRKPNTLSSLTIEGDQPNPWARTSIFHTPDWQCALQRTGNYVDYLHALLNEPEEDVLATVRHFH